MSAELIARVALEKNGFRFTHALGQNFLLDGDVIAALADAARVGAGEHILEIGAGPGLLTQEMGARGADVLSIEIDQALRPVLEAVAPGARIVFGDAMKLDLDELTRDAFGGAPYRVVANLPYYITADILLRLIALKHSPTSITVMVQREAAQRIMSHPGEKNWCALAARMAYYGRAQVLLDVPRGAFTPPPHVDSAFVCIDRRDPRPVQAKRDDMMDRVILAAFAMRRKTLANNLMASFFLSKQRAHALLEACGLPAQVRGEALSLEQLARLSDALSDPQDP